MDQEISQLEEKVWYNKKHIGVNIHVKIHLSVHLRFVHFNVLIGNLHSIYKQKTTLELT